jgi:hypothetical protein
LQRTRQQGDTWPNPKCQSDFQRQGGSHHDNRQHASEEHERSTLRAAVKELIPRHLHRDGVGLSFVIRKSAVRQILFI